MGASSSVRDTLNEEETRLYSGLYFDKKVFDKVKDERGCIMKSTFMKMMTNLTDRLKTKYSDVSPFERDLWEPFLYSKYYCTIFKHGDLLPSVFDYYCESLTEKRRSLLWKSFNLSEIYIMQLKCCGSCNKHFHKGIVCKGTVGLTGERTERNVEGDPLGTTDDQMWLDFDQADPDDISVHLWTYSMSRGGGDTQPAFYKRLNTAVLEDDMEQLCRYGYIICGIIRWIRNHPYTEQREVTLYRGTPINEKQKHATGDALDARYKFTDLVDPNDIAEYTSAKEKTKLLHEKARNICRMPMFVAASENLKKAQDFCWIQSNGIASPILEFKVSAGCDSVAPIMSMSHFPEEKEWLMAAYTPVEYLSQRLEYLEIGSNRQVKLVLVVTYRVLPFWETFREFESNGQDLKTTLIMCQPARRVFDDDDESAESHVLLECSEVHRIEMSALEQDQDHRAELHELKRRREPDALSRRTFGMAESLRESESELEKKRINNKLVENLSDAVRGPEDRREATITQAIEHWFRQRCHHGDVSGATSDAFLRLGQEAYARFPALAERVRSIELKMESHKKELSDLEEEKSGLESEAERLQGIAAACAEELSRIRQNIGELESRQDDIQRNIDDLQEQESEYRNQIDDLQREIRAVEMKQASFTRQLEELRKEERSAFERFRTRKLASVGEGGDGTTEEEFDRLRPVAEAAGQEYLDFVFPPEEFESFCASIASSMETLQGLRQDLLTFKESKERLSIELSDTVSQLDIEQKNEIRANNDLSKAQEDVDNNERLIQFYIGGIDKIKVSLAVIASELKTLSEQLERYWTRVVSDLDSLFDSTVSNTGP